jgi:hypothetical protein
MFRLVQLLHSHDGRLALACMRLLFHMVQVEPHNGAQKLITTIGLDADQVDWEVFRYLLEINVLEQLDFYEVS